MTPAAQKAQDWRDSNPGRANELSKQYRQRHPERKSTSNKQWALKNPEKVREFRLKKYGITPAQFDTLAAFQNGVCAICSAPPTGRKQYLSVDHDHVTGRVRGLLCNECNTALGLLKDNVQTLEAAIKYLQREGQ